MHVDTSTSSGTQTQCLHVCIPCVHCTTWWCGLFVHDWLSSRWVTAFLWEWDKPTQNATARFLRLLRTCKLQSVCCSLLALPQCGWWTFGCHGDRSSIKAPPCHSWAGRLHRGTREAAVVGVPIQVLLWCGLPSHCWGLKLLFIVGEFRNIIINSKKYRNKTICVLATWIPSELCFEVTCLCCFAERIVVLMWELAEETQ